MWGDPEATGIFPEMQGALDHREKMNWGVEMNWEWRLKSS